MGAMLLPVKSFFYMNEMTTDSGGKWGQNIALFAIIVVALFILAFWWCNRSGRDKADLAASIQKLYGQVECIGAQVTKNTDRVDAIGVGLAKTAQSQMDFQNYAGSLLTDLDSAVFVPRCSHGGCNNGCGQSRFVKTTPYTAGTTTLEETDTCCS